MKHIKTTLAALLAVALTGCASTSQPDRTDYPTLTVLNPTPYVWDDKKSLALNVAKMAEPAGVGIGLEDSDKASDASTGKSTSGDRALGLGIMGLSQGVFGLASDSILTDKAESSLNWRPALIDLIPVSDIGSNLTPQSFLKLRTIIGERVITSIQKDSPDMKIQATYTPKKNGWTENSLYLLGGSACHDAIKFQSRKPDEAPKFTSKDFSASQLENVPFPKEYCFFDTKLSIAGITKRDGVDHYIVVSEIISGFHFITNLDEHYPGYLLLPESFMVMPYDSLAKISRSMYPFAIVFYQGKPQPFVSPK